MRVSQIVPSLELRHGGPSRSVYALSQAVAQLGHEVDLLATDPGAPRLREDKRLRIGTFHRDWPQALCPSRGLRRHLATSRPDIVHHHSLWLRTLHYAHHRARVLDVPFVISPRGMMSEWAWQHHGWRKQLVRHLVHPGAFEGAAGWHVTSEEEAVDIRRQGFQQPVCIAPNGVTAPTPEQRTAAIAYWNRTCPDAAHRPTALFYSRFHRKKRVLELIDLWLARVPDDWLLLMVGLPDDYTVRQLETYVLRASGGGRIRVFDGEGCPPPYAVASVFLLPSHSENFGLVVAEAMVNALPVCVTDTTPWRSVNAHGAGWCVPWSDYPSTLEQALGEDREARAARGQHARRHALADFSWDRSARMLVEFYERLRGDTSTA